MRHIIFAILVAVPTAVITWVLSRGGVPAPPPDVAAPATASGAPAAGDDAGKAAEDPDARLRALLAEPLAGAKARGLVTLYDADGLFEYIDGAAPVFIERSFRKLAAAEMVTEDGGELTCDVYDMLTADNATSIYAEEQPGNARALALGDAGRVGNMAVVFRQGRYYVKLTAFDGKADARLAEVAKALSSRIP